MILLAMLALAVMAKMSVGLVVTPSNLLEVGHGAEIKSEASRRAHRSAATVAPLCTFPRRLSIRRECRAPAPRMCALRRGASPQVAEGAMASGGTASNVLWGGPS